MRDFAECLDADEMSNDEQASRDISEVYLSAGEAYLDDDQFLMGAAFSEVAQRVCYPELLPKF